ncbi:MAG: AMP-binding protein [Oscillospiraceae bacterium]|jgi:acetyl-CoA synthetase|nr:AMP-binding protein [Oscillospiraceae bacterium]
MLDRYLPRIEFDSYEDFIKNFKINVPEGFNFGFDVVDEWAKREPDKLALLWCDDHGGERRFTFNDLSKQSNKAANYFKSLGIKKGDVVMCVLRQRFEYWITAIALCKLGAVIIPATMQLTSKDIIYRANAAKIKALICYSDVDDFIVTQVEKALPECPTINTRILTPDKRDGWLPFENVSFPDTFPRPIGAESIAITDPMLIYFTSGTTGMPKMVLHDFTHPLGHIVTAKYWQQVRENKLHNSMSDSGWAKFGWGKIYGQFLCGAPIFAYDMEKFIPKNVLQKLEKYPIATFCAPPTTFRFMLADGMESYDLSSIEHCGNAGEPLSPEIFNKIKGILGLDMFEGFGQSESTVLIANFPWFEPKPGSMGKPAPLYDIDLVDSEGNTCEDGEEGRIIIRNINAIGLFKGYYLDDELTATAFTDDTSNSNITNKKIYDTGDTAWRDPEGYYWFVGRNDDMIKCSGYRIGPFEVESVLSEHDAVLECAITGAPDPKRGQVVKATVVLNKGYIASEELVKELQDYVKKTTAPYKYPRIIEFVTELPKTISGKIKRAQIRKEL